MFQGSRRPERKVGIRTSGSRKLRPRLAGRHPEGLQNAPVYSAKDLTHQLDCSVGDEAGAVNIRPADLGREEAGAIHVPHVICFGWLSDQWWAVGKAGSPESSRAEMFHSAGKPEGRVAATEERGDAITSVHNRASIF